MPGRTVGYARVSTDEQDADPQVDRLRQAGCEPVFRDDGISGALASRPQWDACLKELRAGDTLVATKLDRFGRSMSHLAALFEGLESRQVSVRCLDQPIDTTTAVGKLLIGILSAFAEFERNLTRERIVDKMKYNAHAGKVARGRALGRDEDDGDPDRRAFGFEDDNVAIREAEAAVIQQCAERLLAGEPQAAIIADLNAGQVRSMRGAQWGYTTFRQIMTRPKNAGYHTYRGEIIPGVRLPEAILDQATYDSIVALFAGRRAGRQPSGKYLLTGFVDCHCGTPLKGRPVTGTNRRQYWCPAKHAPGRTFITAGPLDDHIADWTIRTLADPTLAEAIAAQEAAQAAELAELDNAIARAKDLANQVADRLGRGEMELDRYEAIVKPLDVRIAELRIRRDVLAAAGVAPVTPIKINPVAWTRGSLLAEWEDGTMADRRAMIRRALAGRRIVIEPGKPGPFDSARVSVG